MDHKSAAVDFRAYLDYLQKNDELVVIDEKVDPVLEVGAIVRKVYETRAPAPLFTALAGDSRNFRILGAPAGMSGKPGQAYSRLAAHFSLPKQATPKQILEKIIAAADQPPITPTIAQLAPCKENILIGADVDLNIFPIPLLHQEDGGCYFATYGFHIVQSPDGKWDSWSVARAMLHDKNTLVGPAMPQQHIGMIHNMWREQGKNTPWAMVLGAPPAAMAVAGMPLPAWTSEPGYIGALTGEAVEVVKCETNDLYVPATAEIVVEGEISLDETAPEGPMGEYHGYSFAEGKKQPVFHVKAITFRDRAILPICVAGTPPEENHTIWGTMISAEALNHCRRENLPIDMAWCSYEAATCWLVLAVDTDRLAAMHTDADGFVQLIVEKFFSSHVAWLVPKILLVGNDIDITDINQVVWALATRSHPKRDFYDFTGQPGIPMVPYLDDEDKQAGHGGKMIINCLLPEQFSGKMRATTACFEHSYPDEIKQRVERKWHKYGF
ncbi:UbiD family decarboxylase [Serratia proteamaculans]|uniref:Pyrrole-2-carboxylic acid decarboxylase n=1 Tax=Serratia proteamaculans TaxID=28151 RepID=A0A5Q2VAN4_SERPR|nr:UbiD family decarboxylase [Serratia proteamaculans]QGH60393.1 UbiD family decarboxylase [Serratia proteamaculans]